MPLQTGTQFGHYTIQDSIVHSETYDIYRAIDTQTECNVALKIPSRATVVNPDQYDYFLREIQALNILHHVAVQHLLESGHYDQTPFLATELIEGQSLRHLIKAHGALPIDKASLLIRKIMDGVAYCHLQGVIHRDLKPENIIITQGEQPVIIDFGLSLTRKRQSSGKPAGTPEYAAPEQIQGRRGDERTDIYALGIILYEMIAGSTPFVGDDLLSALAVRLHSAVPRLDKVRSDAPLALATIVAKCLQHDPKQRYPTMGALIADMEHPEQVDTSALEALSRPPPKPSFFQTQPGQALLTTAVFILGVAILTVFLVALKH